MTFYYRIITTVLIAVLFPHVLLTAQDSVTVNQSVIGADTSPPLPPASVTATAISQTEIDLTWTTSTDNVGVTGYQVFREFVQIATSTVESYSDTGLLPATLYSYTIVAFDAALNIGLHSATSSATTFSTPSTPSTPPPSSSGGGNGPIQTSNIVPLVTHIEVTASTTDAVIFWNTNVDTEGTLSWGRTTDYDKGSLTEVFFGKNHITRINNLIPNTLYYFKIDLVSTYGITGTLTGQTFKTKDILEGKLFPNVTTFSVIPDKDSIFLKWVNPPSDKFEEVRIVRLEKTYPKDPLDGKVVYEGRDSRSTDTDTREGVTYYYAIFAKDKTGNYSSGAVGQGSLLRGRSDTPIDQEFSDTENNITPDIETNEYYEDTLVLQDFEFRQDGILIPWRGATMTIDATKNYEISIPYKKIPDPTRIVIIGLQDVLQHETVYTFLLRADDTRDVYEGTMSPIGERGEYNLKIKTLTSKSKEIKILSGLLIAKDKFPTRVQTITYTNICFWFILILIIIIILLVIFDRKKRRQDEFV
ncbi:MAG: fibronectin type III domain-containing protein [bacterium]|nr:fibronectin type III domain-containing protein [bacterium]